MIMVFSGEFQYHLDAMSVFHILQVASVNEPGGHVKDQPSHRSSPSGVFSLFPLALTSVSYHLTLFLYVDTSQAPSRAAPPQMRVSGKGASYARITCMTWSVISHHVACSINAPHIKWEKLHPACHKFKSAITLKPPKIYNLYLTLSCL